MAFTPDPRAESSSASLLGDVDQAAALSVRVVHAHGFGDWCMPPIDGGVNDRATVLGPSTPLGRQWRSTAVAPQRLTSKSLRERAGRDPGSISGPYAGLVPALLTRMSMAAESVECQIDRTAVRPSSVHRVGGPPSGWRCFGADPAQARLVRALSCLREVSTMFGPCGAPSRLCDGSNPIPREPPVMIAVRVRLGLVWS